MRPRTSLAVWLQHLAVAVLPHWFWAAWAGVSLRWARSGEAVAVREKVRKVRMEGRCIVGGWNCARGWGLRGGFV